MASPTDLTKCLSETLGIAEATCDSTWKELRASRLVVNSGRGKRGTQVSAKDCAVYLLALCGADHVKNSVNAAEAYGNCVVEADESDAAYRAFRPLSNLGSQHTLLAAITKIVEAYAQDNLPEITVTIPLPSGKSTSQRTASRVSLTLISPPPDYPAYINVNGKLIAEYHRRKSTHEMFGGLFEGGKNRLAGGGDLKIEKTISGVTFTALGRLIRE